MSTERSAYVRIVNSTDSDLLSVCVNHKYSDVGEYTKTINFPEFKKGAGSMSRNPSTRVKYHTGFGTTGVDWWQITWVKAGSPDVYMSDPHNFRGAIDFVEQIDRKVMAPVVAIGGAIALADPEPVSKAIAAASFVVAGIAETLTNDASTAGFKQHMLTEEDEEHDVTITLSDKVDDGITFRSPSGVSHTNVKILKI